MRHLISVFALTTLVLSTGCSETGSAPSGGSAKPTSEPARAASGGDRVKECKALQKIMEDGDTKLEKLPESDDPSKDLLAQAKLLNETADAVEKSGVTDGELKGLATRYAKVMRDQAKQQTAAANAAKKGDEKALDKVEKDGEASAKEELEITAKVAVICES
jgi:hypothetical protein